MAAPMPPWLKEAWIEWLGPERIFEFYGGTEGQGATTITGTEWLAHRGSVGRPTLSEMRILDEAGGELPPGEVGEIYMRRLHAEASYHYLGAQAREAGERWESIGDFGWMDADGYLYLADRRTDLILSGGANIYPAEVEAALDGTSVGVEVAVVIEACRTRTWARPCTPWSSLAPTGRGARGRPADPGRLRRRAPRPLQDSPLLRVHRGASAR